MPEPIYKTLGMIIRGQRRRLEYPQEKLAKQLGISRATLASIETGRQRVLVHQLYAFAEALRLEPSDLLPLVSDSATPRDIANLRIDGDVNPKQREQIAHLIGSQSLPRKLKGKLNAKTTKSVPGNSR